jgi:hypothetical protein
METGCGWCNMASDKRRAGFAAQEAWAEMDAFLDQCEATPTMTDEERVELLRQFLDIQERCNAKILAIFDRATAGRAVPHLHLVRKEDEKN